MVPGRESDKIVWPLVKVAGALVALLLLATEIAQVHVPVESGTLPLTLSAFVAVRSGQIVVKFTVGVALSTVALALLFALRSPWTESWCRFRKSSRRSR